MSHQTSDDKPLQDSITESIPVLRKFIAKKVKANQDVDDLVQETVVRSLKSAGHRSVSNPIAYLFTAAKTVLIDYWQKTNIDIEELTEEHEPGNANLEAGELNRKKLEAIHNVVNAMPALRREVFIRKRLEGQSREEIATALNISIDAVKKHINRALTDLADGMDDSGWGEE